MRAMGRHLPYEITHKSQVNAPRLNPSPLAGTRFTYPGGWKAELTWCLVKYRDDVPAKPR